MWIDKNLYQFEVPGDFGFTGKLNATLSANYEIDGSDASPSIALSFDVLIDAHHNEVAAACAPGAVLMPRSGTA